MYRLPTGEGIDHNDREQLIKYALAWSRVATIVAEEFGWVLDGFGHTHCTFYDGLTKHDISGGAVVKIVELIKDYDL